MLRRYWWVWAPPLAVGAAMLVALTYVYVSLPLPKAPPAKQTTFLYDRQGNFLKTLHGEVDRVIVPLEDVPVHMRQAVIASEDEDFYSHPGVSLPAIARAAWANVRGKAIEQGASTITQQYVRNAFPTEFGFLVDPEATEAKGQADTEVGGFEKSITRKLKEALVALKIERKLSKNEILERYLNTIYFGRGAYGVEAAAKRYFGISAKDLTRTQSATLAGLISSPEANNPIQYPERAKQKRDRVLGLMSEMGFISEAQTKELQQEPVEIHQQAKQTRRQKTVTGTAAYFVDHASRYLQGKYGDQTFVGGLRVTTSIDLKMQRLAEKAVTNHLRQKGDPDVALVAMDPRNGEIRAMIGGKNFRKAKCNLATARGGGDNCGTGRQTGSAFKMFTIAAAVEKGISLRSTFSGPGHIVMRDNPECGEWATRGVSNYSDSGAGTMDLVGATAKSVNTIFAQLIAEVGAERVVKLAHKMGIESDLPAVCSLTLGVAPVSPLEMTTSFATIASGGVRHDPTPVHEVKTADGEKLFKASKKGKRVLKANQAWQIATALRAVVTGGTGTAASLPGVEVIGKTGTSENHTNAYFCGTTRILTTCVWVGHKKANIPMNNVHGISVTGGSYPARIWHDFMAPIHQGRKVPGFPDVQLTGKTVKGKGVSAPAPKKKKKKSNSGNGGGGVVPTTPPPPSPTPSPSPTCELPPCATGGGTGGSGTTSGKDEEGSAEP